MVDVVDVDDVVDVVDFVNFDEFDCVVPPDVYFLEGGGGSIQ